MCHFLDNFIGVHKTFVVYSRKKSEFQRRFSRPIFYHQESFAEVRSRLYGGCFRTTQSSYVNLFQVIKDVCGKMENSFLLANLGRSLLLN